MGEPRRDKRAGRMSAGPGPKIVPHVPRYNNTDVGNSLRFANEHGDVAKYVRGLGWVVWDGRCWVEDDEGGAHRMARRTAAKMWDDGTALGGDRGQKLATWARESESHNRIQAMVAQARSQESVMAKAAEFDRDSMLLNVGNGIVDLRTGRVRGHDPRRKLTKITEADYRPDAKCPLWRSFMKKAMNGDTDLVEYLQRAVGYSLTGMTSEDTIFILYGPTGSNGKTTFLETVMQCMGSYAGTTGPETFLRKTKSGHNTPELAKLRGLRLVGSYEAEKGAMFDEARLKALTGGDEIEATAKYKAPVTYRPEFKVWFRTNHLPNVDANDEGVWRRVHVVPFTHEFRGEDCDKGMRDRLPEEEAEGILAWMVQGAMEWQRDGLGCPSAVRRTTRSYRLEQEDSVGLWLSTETVKDDTGERRRPHYGLYRRYEVWCGKNDHKSAGAKDFHATLMERGYSKDGTNPRKGPGFWGLALVHDDEEG